MENPFELIITKLERIEALLQELNLKQAGLLNTQKTEKYMNVKQLAEYLSLSTYTIYTKVHNKSLPYYKKGKTLYFMVSEIDQWLAEGKRKPYVEVLQDPSNYLRKRSRH